VKKMTLTTEEEIILNKQIEIDALQATLDKKRENHHSDETHDDEILYSKKLALAILLEAHK
jgi:hypothetical protein